MRFLQRVATTGAAMGVVMALAAPASAHVVKDVGTYQLTVGWKTEPAYTGVPNAVYLAVHDAAGKAVDDIGDKLKLVVSTAGKTSDPLELALSFDEDTGIGSHGEFDAPIIPTQPGVYTFHFTGAINNHAVDESFTSSDSTFDEVVNPTVAEFPDKTPTAGEVATNVGRLGARVDAAKTTATSADDSASSAKTLGILALIVGIVLGGGALVLGLSGRRTSKP